MANFEELFNKYNPLADAVPGGADLEAKNAYWIELGARRAEERIIKLLEAEKSRSGIGFIQYKVLLELLQPEVE